ncbi:bifunctional aconitate hydratase 2/2-methylisocitrate dehydratase [Syntrophotalea acetylenica]|uniref:Aconitate hydratase B n=1 Tax=Syntrophotalea acetylenica TaxID=29542 RepID=A0A1L3GHG4_SYNAC|nr:bifunctional aconitate hydratase 2/2-methylisocitrate dehydratase [Syntrophotalea acetylenica]APG25377.1 bifunctional aconitate hydratase 2/2-methylisocitrate dehydratase [Syntrophotalea acetylenica]APG43444.1 aconitate hydratase B [Syntrophotalea acetylenica]
MLNEYLHHVDERAALGIPPLPLDVPQTQELCRLLTAPPAGREALLVDLLENRISPGVDPSAQVKAEFLGRILGGVASSPLIGREDAIRLLGAMLGGYNIAPLMAALRDDQLASRAASALSGLILVYDAFEDIQKLAAENVFARQVIESWARADWFHSRPEIPARLRVKIFKVEGEINTDDFSPAGDAWSRPDIPLHALSMGHSRFVGGIETIARWRREGHQIAFAGDVVGTGSSRKSACNSLLWHIGEDIPGVPNKRRGGVIIGGAIAPIFFNTAQDSGALPIRADVDRVAHGDEVIIEPLAGRILDAEGKLLTTFDLSPNTLPDEYRAGGRIPLIIGRALTDRARKALDLEPASFFTRPDNPVPPPDQAYTLAQKLVGRACGLPGVLPGTACEPRMTTVGSQDTTGPMTADELKELACLKFQTPLFMQSFCHTAAYPKTADVKMHRTLPAFMSQRGGVALRPGDGVIHSWLNRLLLPDTVGTGGDSHTRFPVGISFPAGSGLVAFAGALGFMPLDMPESVLVRFRGSLQPGITLRDVVNAVPYAAIGQGLLTVPKKNKKNIFNGRILEMEGLDDLTVEQAFELTCAAAERSAAAGCIQLSEERVAAFLRSNVALMKSMIADGYEDAETLERRISAVEQWLAEPRLLRADAHAGYAAVIEVDLDELKEPLVCCPNDPDDVRPLSEIAGEAIDDVFIGSCMSNIGHFRAAAALWEGRSFNAAVRTWVCPPTRMDYRQLRDEARLAIFSAVGARIEMPGCSLCMGNQARVPAGARVFSTSTRNFDNRLGDDARVYLGSAELAAIVATLGRIPTPDRYFSVYQDRIAPREEEIYRYLQFDEMEP